jgi:hypothetical protein
MARWRDRVIKTWREWWGSQLVAIVEHLDEARYHLHGLVVAPLRAGRVAMGEIFPAVAARQTARETGQTKRMQDRAYKTGLRALQDAFHAAVSAFEGHARVGPRRQRLTRQEWRARRAEERAARAEAEAAAGREALALVERARRAAEQIERAGGWRASRTDAERQARLIDRIRAEMR